jgi:hypothetical protein
MAEWAYIGHSDGYSSSGRSTRSSDALYLVSLSHQAYEETKEREPTGPDEWVEGLRRRSCNRDKDVLGNFIFHRYEQYETYYGYDLDPQPGDPWV